MKTVKTQMSEQRFLSRLEGLCRKKTRFDKGYVDKDTFVIKRKGNKFWLAKHYASLGRSDGYAMDCLYCKYGVDQNGYVFVKYTVGKRLTYLIPFGISFIIGAFLWVSIIYDTIVYHQSPDGNGIAVAALFWALSLVGTLLRSKKERTALEEHLLSICKCSQ